MAAYMRFCIALRPWADPLASNRDQCTVSSVSYNWSHSEPSLLKPCMRSGFQGKVVKASAIR